MCKSVYGSETPLIRVNAEYFNCTTSLMENTFQRAKLKMKLLELKEEEYRAIQEKQYLKADGIKNKINTLSEEIIRLSEAPPVSQATGTEEIKEKNDPETMIKCLAIMCTMMQSATLLTPTLRSLMQIALDSLDVSVCFLIAVSFQAIQCNSNFQHIDDNVHILAIRAVSICCILDAEEAKKHIMMLFLQFSLEQENEKIWIEALKGIFDLLLLYGLQYFDIIENPDSNNTTNKPEKSRTIRLYNDPDQEVSVTSVDKSNGERGNCHFIKILAGLLDNAVSVCNVVHKGIFIYVTNCVYLFDK